MRFEHKMMFVATTQVAVGCILTDGLGVVGILVGLGVVGGDGGDGGRGLGGVGARVGSTGGSSHPATSSPRQSMLQFSLERQHPKYWPLQKLKLGYFVRRSMLRDTKVYLFLTIHNLLEDRPEFLHRGLRTSLNWILLHIEEFALGLRTVPG